MATVLRRRATAVGVKIETTQGTDAWAGSLPAAATDFVRADVTVAFNQQVIPNTELTGFLDTPSSIPGGTKVQLTLTCFLKGSGAGGTAPQWGKLMQACGYSETLTGSAIGAPTAAASGTTSTATLASPFAATAELYRGMPITLSGNPATPVTVGVVDYTVGRVMKPDYVFGTSLSSSTLAQIPPNALYSPLTDPTLMKSVSVYLLMDGLGWLICGRQRVK